MSEAPKIDVQKTCSEIIETYGPELRGYLRGALHSAEEGDDLYQDLCEVLLRRLPSFEKKSSLRTWLYGIAHNLVRQKFTTYSFSHKERLDTQAEADLPAPSASSTGEQRSRKERLETLLKFLDSEERALIILRINRKMSHKEIGEILDISADGARQRFHRASEKLRRLLEGK